MKTIRALFFVATMLCTSAYPSFAATTNLGLSGCDLVDVATNSDGSLLLAACYESPNGIFFSQDFGDTWTFAEGGDYTEGRGDRVSFNSTHAFAQSFGRLYTAALPQGQGVWTPNWVELPNGVTTFTLAGDRLYFSVENQVKLASASTGAVSQTTTLPDSGRVAYGLTATSTHLFAVVYSVQSGLLQVEKVQRAPLDGSGQIGTWADVSVPGGVKPFGVDVAPNGTIYFPAGNKLFSSANGGDTVNDIATASGFSTGCFSGNIHIQGRGVSTDTGSSFTPFTTLTTDMGARAASSPCVINPTNPDVVIFTVDSGLIKTTNFSNPTPTFHEASTGLNAATVYGFAQRADNKNRVVTSTASGYSYTDTFLSDSITWINDCPDRSTGCSSTRQIDAGKALVADPSDTSKFYTWLEQSDKIYTATATGSGAAMRLTWTELTTIPALFAFTPRSFSASEFLPNSFVAAYVGFQSPNYIGGAYQYSTADGSITKQMLDGKPVTRFHAISASVFFALVGDERDAGTTTPYTRGVYRSTDAGATWNVMSDADLPDNTKFEELAYDSGSDMLFMVDYSPTTYQTAIYRLPQAAAGGTAWAKALSQPSGGNLPYAIAVSPLDHTVYMSAASEIYESKDLGDTWMKLAQGKTGEHYFVLFFDDLVGGSNRGLQSVGNPTCALTLAKAKKPAVLPKARKATFAYDGFATQAQIEFLKKKTKKWKTLKRFSVTSANTRVNIKVTAPGKIRAKVANCTSAVISATVKGN